MTKPDHRIALQISLAMEPILDRAASASTPATYAKRLDGIAAALHAEADAVAFLATEARQSCKPANPVPRRSKTND